MITAPVSTTVVAPTVVAPTFGSPSRVTSANRIIDPQSSPRYYENNPSGGKVLYINPTFPNGYVASPHTATVYNPA